MTERDWELLKVVYEEKSITKASKQLYLSQPAVSRRLQMIEEEFEVKVVERTSRGVVFTEQGRYLVEFAEKMIENLNTIKRELNSMGEKTEGVIRIGAANNFSQKTLPILLAEYKKQYPEVEFDIVTGWSMDIYKLLCDRKVDIAFIRGQYKWSQGEKSLFSAGISIISANKIKLEDLPLLNKIEYNSDSKLKIVIDNWWNSRFLEAPMKCGKVDSIATCIELVKQGMGYAIVPSTVIKEEDRYYRMDIKDENGEKIKRITRTFYHNSWKQIEVGKTFLKFLDEYKFKNK